MSIPLEDNYTDVIAKAQRGLGLADSVLAERAGLPIATLKQLKNGTVADEALAAIAPVLGLNPAAFQKLAHGDYQPAVEPPAGLAAFNTPFENMTVNSYLIWDEATRLAVAFDTGSDVTELLYHLTVRGLKLTTVLLTHAHMDHIYDLDRLVEKTAAAVYTPERESVEDANAFPPGQSFTIGALKIHTLLTNGHSPGGMTYVVEGLCVPIAVVGDSLFAGSMGGAGTTWQLALRNNRENILTLPRTTVICPGHGPMTTVGLERVNNPFFPSE